MRRTLAAAALLAGACQPVTPAAPAPEPAAPQASTLPDGATLTYTRSNVDGSLPETILVHVVSAAEVHVAKMVERCRDAAYVTAVFDPATGEATQLVGGRLQKDSTQLPQAWLTLDAAARKLDVRIGDAAGAPVESHPAPPAPWRMYDFDLAEFALFGPREAKDFSFGLALAWPDAAPPLVQVLGEAHAKFVASETLNGAAVNRFAVSGVAFGGNGGEAVFDTASGHVVEARFGKPNHSGYKDFLLKLDSAAIENGSQAWRDALAAHWKDC